MSGEPRQKSCSNPVHPKGTLGRVVWEGRRTVRRERVCGICGGIQGIALVFKRGSR